MTEIRAVAAAATRPLRQQVLRPHQSPEELVYPGDDAAGSFHLAAYEGERLVGTISLSLEGREGGPGEGRAYRLRGMATHPDLRGTGLGTRLLVEAIRRMVRAGGERVWCNARSSAAGFYARHGFDVVSEEFELPDLGPHVVMERFLSM